MPKTRETPVGVFTRTLNWRISEPIEYITVAQAREMRKSGQWFSVNSGNDIAEAAPAITEIPEHLTKSKWAARPSGLPSIGYVNVLQLI